MLFRLQAIFCGQKSSACILVFIFIGCVMDRKFRVPRVWSNAELAKFSGDFKGEVVNVSGWQDFDKVDKFYKDYFSSADEYWITNYDTEENGFQGGMDNEIFLNLEEELDEVMRKRFDVVFNHTVLEHVFNVDKAFSNLCAMSKDVVIVVLPFLQEQHASYGDYWRFTPMAVERLFEKNGFQLVYINFNDARADSIYIFAIGSRIPGKWSSIFDLAENKVGITKEYMLGQYVIGETFWDKVKRKLGIL